MERRQERQPARHTRVLDMIANGEEYERRTRGGRGQNNPFVSSCWHFSCRQARRMCGSKNVTMWLFNPSLLTLWRPTVWRNKSGATMEGIVVTPPPLRRRRRLTWTHGSRSARTRGHHVEILKVTRMRERSFHRVNVCMSFNGHGIPRNLWTGKILFS